MSDSRVSVRRLLRSNFEKSGEPLQNFTVNDRIDASDDFLPLTTLLHPNDIEIPSEIKRDNEREVIVYRYEYPIGAQPQSGFTLRTSFHRMRKQCVLYTKEYKYESPFGGAPQARSFIAAAETFFPGRTTIRKALRVGRMSDMRIRRQIFLYEEVTVAYLNEFFNEVFDVGHEDIVFRMSFYSCLVHRAIAYKRYTVPSLVIKSYIAGDISMRRQILYAMYANECILCGMIGKTIYFHDVSVMDDDSLLQAAVNQRCRVTSLESYFDFNANEIFFNHAAWVSSHVIVVYSAPCVPIPWSSKFGYVSIITTFLRLVRANLGRPVTSNSIARAYIIMLKGYIRDLFGLVAAENAFIRGLYILEGVYFDFPHDNDEIFKNYNVFSDWLTSPLPLSFHSRLLIDYLFNDSIYATNADIDGLFVYLPVIPII